jgi:Mg-chelatase subunit ChlD
MSSAFAKVTSCLSACLLASSLASCNGAEVGASAGNTGGSTSVGGASGGGSRASTGVPLVIPDASTTDGFDPTTPTENSNCGLTSFDVNRRPADLLLVLDRSGSMSEHDVPGINGQSVTRAQAAKDAVNEVIKQTEAGVRWGLKMFPEGSSAYCVVTDKIDVEVGLNNYAALSAIVNKDSFDGDGTPTAAAVSEAAKYLSALNDGNSKYLVLATDGEPSSDSKNQCTGTWAEPDVRSATVNAVAAAAKQGIKTYVIGVNTTSSANATLNRLVQAGQTADPPIATGEDVSSSKNTTQHYYPADDFRGLVESLSKITGQVSDCRFPLDRKPEVPDNVVVKVTDGAGVLVRVPLDSQHSDGWDYADTDLRTIQVYGSWCDKVKAATANNKVSIIFGCKGQIIP